MASASLERRTDRTKVRARDLGVELALVPERGYSTENQENEPGMAGLALPVFLGSPSAPTGAVSIATLVYRRPLQTLIDDLPAIRAIVGHRAHART